MTRENIQMFMIQNQKNFDAAQMPIIQQQLERMDDSQLTMVSAAGYKDPTTALILSIFFGGLGVDRFYIGDTGMGLLKLLLLTWLTVGIFPLVDIFLIMGKTREANYTKFMQVANMAPAGGAAPQGYGAYNQNPQNPQLGYAQPQQAYQPQQQPYQQPAYQQPTYQQPTYQQPTYQQPQQPAGDPFANPNE